MANKYHSAAKAGWAAGKEVVHNSLPAREAITVKDAWAQGKEVFKKKKKKQ